MIIIELELKKSAKHIKYTCRCFVDNVKCDNFYYNLYDIVLFYYFNCDFVYDLCFFIIHVLHTVKIKIFLDN